MRTTLFVDVLLPLPLPGTFTYRVPFDMNEVVAIGKRAVVQFGKTKIYSALIRRIHTEPPNFSQIKYIISILDEEPIVNEIQYKFWEWLSEYYMCTPGEIMNAALPSALKLASESRIVMNPSFDLDYSGLNEKEFLITEALELQSVLTITEVTEIVEQLKVLPLIKTLIEKGVVLIEEELINKFRPKTETYVRLHKDYLDEEELKKAFDILGKRAFKQLEILMTFISMKNSSEKNKEILRTELIKKSNSSHTQLNSLIEKGIFEISVKEVSRFNFDNDSKIESIILTDHQQIAFDNIKTNFNTKDVTLLHGVTSSGKTEVYIKLIQEYIDSGKQVLYLLPEIALTTQIINRLKKYFGNKVGIYHSKFSINERAEVWNNVLGSDLGEYKVVLGARSAVFLPFHNLGLIVIDEEHDTSYKQYDPSPRYNCRDAAIYLASMHKAKVLLGSATPSVESYYNAKSGKFGLAELKKRFSDIQMPEILVVDTDKARKQKDMKSHFSNYLLNHMSEALENKEQIILFQNRRGFSLRTECNVCHWVPQCKNCDVTLTYHKHYNQLRCHYCGYSTKVPSECPSCRNAKLLMKGFGTEKIEDEMPLYFPDAKISRMDLDTTRKKNAHQQIIFDFEDRKIDILAGTQMLTKGLDFDHVSIVGILNADNMISFPDFRSFERSFQQLTQVSGRAGRKNKRGKVIIQTQNPYHSVIRYVIDNDYDSMFKSQISERRNFKYPPFYRLIKLTLKHRMPDIVNESARELAESLRDIFGKDILGPEYPLVSRIKNQYIKDIIIKLQNKRGISYSKKAILKCINVLHDIDRFKSVTVVIDVDPY